MTSKFWSSRIDGIIINREDVLKAPWEEGKYMNLDITGRHPSRDVES
jgi:hypothetical protein